MKMINIKQTTIFLLLLLFLGSCSKQTEGFYAPEREGTGEGTITLQVTAPSADGLRAQLLEKEGTNDFIARFKAEDNVLLYVVQEGIVYELGATQFADLSSDGKQAKLTFTMPEGVDTSKPVDIIGYNGFHQGSGANWDPPKIVVNDKNRYEEKKDKLPETFKDQPALLVAASPYIGKDLSEFSAPCSFRLEQVMPTAENLENQKVHFEHLGAYEIVYFENKSSEPMQDVVGLSEPGNMMNKTYVHNSGYRRGTGVLYPVIDLVTGNVVYLPSMVVQNPYVSASTHAPGDTKAYVTWVVPNPEVDNIPELVILKGTYSATSSKGVIPGRKGGMQKGAAYITHGYWDGTNVVALDKDNNERKAAFITITTALPKGSDITFKAYVSYNGRDDAFIDLNANGQKDPGEEPGSWEPKTYKVDATEITFYGAFETIEVPKQQITKVEMSPSNSLYSLDIRKNQLSTEALNTLIEQIPDRTGVTPDILKPLTLSISGNPGLEGDVHLLQAVEKNWKLDVPIIRNDQPQNYIELKNTKGLYYAVDADPADRPDVWIDLNNNGQKEEGEEITKFGPTQVQRADVTSTHLVIYGKLTSITLYQGAVSSYWGIQSDPKYGNPALKHLSLSGMSQMMIAVTGIYPELETLLLNDCPWFVLINTAKLPFVKNPEKLRSLSLGNSGATARQYNVPSNTIDFTKMTGLVYLDIEGWGWNDQEADLSNLPKLERLVAKGNQLTKLNLSVSTNLKYVELIQNQLDAAAINALLESLPDRTGKSPGQLYLAGNPGSGKGQYKIARDKNWRVDVRNTISDHPARRPNMEGEDW